jgi:hypothetical protein
VPLTGWEKLDQSYHLFQTPLSDPSDKGWLSSFINIEQATGFNPIIVLYHTQRLWQTALFPELAARKVSCVTKSDLAGGDEDEEEEMKIA